MMIRDPKDKRERPEDVLDIPQTATADEVAEAYARFMADPENVSRAAEAMQARARLTRNAWRIEDDLLCYPVSPLGMSMDAIPPCAPFEHEPQPPAYHIEAVELAAHWPVDASDHSPLSARRVAPARIGRLEEEFLANFPIEFPV